MQTTHGRTLSDRELIWCSVVTYLASLVILGPTVAFLANSARVGVQVLLVAVGSLLVVTMVGLTAGVVGEVRRARRSMLARTRRDQRSTADGGQEQPALAMPQAA